MNLKFICNCGWKWKRVLPGLSATKSNANSWYPTSIMTSFVTPEVGLAADAGHFEAMPVQGEWMDVVARIAELQAVAASAMDRSSGRLT
jgi:hypothetical protein